MLNGSRRLVSRVEEGYLGTSDQNDQTSNLSDWYQRFNNKLLAEFVPTAAGGILTLVQLENGKVKSLSFLGLQPIPEIQDGYCFSRWPEGNRDSLGCAGNPSGGSFQLT